MYFTCDGAEGVGGVGAEKDFLYANFSPTILIICTLNDLKSHLPFI